MKTTTRLRERVRWVAANQTDVLMVTICFVFAAVGLAIALSASANGDRSNTLSGVATTLFFGLCGVGYFGLKHGDRLANASIHRCARRRSQ